MKVSVLIAHYHESAQPFLTACLRSLEKQTFKDFETILVSSNHHPITTGVIDKQYHSPTRLHFPAAITKAYEMIDSNSTHILLLNDDCIMANNCLEQLVGTMERYGQEMILGPKSNCGPIMGFYMTISGFYVNGEANYLQPQFRKEVVEAFGEQMIENSIQYPYGMIKIPFSPFFCTLFRKSTYEKIGRINPDFKTGADDHEMAIRAAKHGISCYVALHATAHHASGVSADVGLTQEDRAFNHNLFAEITGR